MTDEIRLFPLILDSADKALGCPAFIKWSAMSQGWAYQNHDQTLERLAARGGLSPCEAAANIQRRQWRPMRHEDAVAIMKLNAP